MKTLVIQELKYKHFEEMMLLEKKYYSEEYFAPAEEAYKWYLIYPYTTVAASYGENIVGFVNMFPVKKNVFESIKAGIFNDQKLTIEDIDKLNSRTLYMFLSCIVVDKEYRKMGITQLLLRSAIKQYEKVSDRIKWIIIDNVTKEGEAFSNKYEFTFVRNSDHDSKIYVQSYKNFVEKISQFENETDYKGEV